MKIAYQGEPGAYSEQTCIQYLGDVETLPCRSFAEVFSTVLDGRANHGLIPIENSLMGSIHQNYDLLLRYPLWVTGEYFLRVQHCLIAFPGMQKHEIRKVISHPQALGQCRDYLEHMPGITQEAVYDTAGSVKILRTSGERTTAAIASRHAADLYRMEVLEEGIEDNLENFTRFLLISQDAVDPPAPAKTSIVYSMSNEPGSLFKVMSVFALRDIDLTKIESRPLIGKPWDYLFYMDFSGSTEEQHVKNALSNLEEFTSMLRIFGSYPRGRLPNIGAHGQKS
jgi:prephenate dehydratase